MTPPRRTTAWVAPLVCLLVLVAGLGACDGSGGTGTVGAAADPVTLRIEATSWNGWSESSSPAVPEVTTEEVHLHSLVTIEAMGPVTFEVTEVGDGEIRLHSSQNLAPATLSGVKDRKSTRLNSSH